MLDWLWQSWKRKPKHPPNSLAYFQVYGEECEPSDQYSGPVWRYRVPHEVKLECHLLPVLDQPSFLTLPRRPSLQVYPPVFQVAGQLHTATPEKLPIDEWMAQGTLWWLKRLGTAQVTGLLAYLLLVGHQRLERQRFPEIDQTMSFLLADHKRVPHSRPTVLVAPEVVEPGLQPPLRARPWSKFPVEVTAGRARVQFLDRRDGKSCWRVGRQEFWQPLYEDVPLSLLIEVEDWSGSQTQLVEQVRAAFVSQIPALLPRLARYPAANRRLRPLLQKLADRQP